MYLVSISSGERRNYSGLSLVTINNDKTARTQDDATCMSYEKYYDVTPFPFYLILINKLLIVGIAKINLQKQRIS